MTRLISWGFTEFLELEALDSEEDDLIPVVTVRNRTVPITEVDDQLIQEMSPQEKETYIQVYQEYYSHVLD